MKKVPFVTKEKLEEIIREYPTPFHLYDERGIRRNIRELKEAFAWNKGYKEYFAVKATPNPFLIDILREYGCGCDCSSYTELMLSDAIGARGEDIMFSSNDTPAEEFVFADQLGAIINLDDITHIEFLEKAIGHIPETISCRYNPGGLFKISNDIMDNPGDAKYGMTTEQLFEAFKTLKEKGAKEFGIHAFLASNTVTNEYYPMLAKVLFETAVKLQKETGVHIKFINLSGGIGIPYTPDQEPNDIRAIGDGVRRVYEEVLIPAGMGEHGKEPAAHAAGYGGNVWDGRFSEPACGKWESAGKTERANVCADKPGDELWSLCHCFSGSDGESQQDVPGRVLYPALICP